MIALKHNGLYPLFDSNYRWVFVDGQRFFNPADIDPTESFIAVDADIAEYLKEHDIILEWSRFTINIQTASIKSVCGKSTKDITKSGNTFQTLAEIITGTKGKMRGPKNSFHANDWTRSAFDRDVTEPKHELTSNEILERVLSHDDLPNPNATFDLPHRDVITRHIMNDDIKYMYPNKVVALPIATYNNPPDKTLEQVTAEFESILAEILPTPKPKTRVYTYIIAVAIISALTFIWTS